MVYHSEYFLQGRQNTIFIEILLGGYILRIRLIPEMADMIASAAMGAFPLKCADPFSTEVSYDH